MKPITYREICTSGANFLADFASDPHSVARRILCIVCSFTKIDLIKNENQIIPEIYQDKYFTYLKRYKNHEPLSRLEGYKNFYGFDFKISNHTLDPRPETELLIDLLCSSFPDTKSTLQILDIGTGSGCLAITAARIYSNASIMALDICDKAIIIANENAHSANVEKQINFQVIKNDLLESNIRSNDVILCNPPYIPQCAYGYLDRSVIDYDPEIALFCGDDGLDFYGKLAKFSINHLDKEGTIFVEFGIGQAKCVKNIFNNHGFCGFQSFKDAHDIIRAARIYH